MSASVNKIPVSGYEVYNSPEFKALCDRFGIMFDLPTKVIIITLTIDEAIISQTYPCFGDAKPLIVATTTMKNETYKTGKPPLDEDCFPTYIPRELR